MAAVGIFGVLMLGLLVLAPLALYWLVSAEEPDDDRGTSWNEARQRARNDDDPDREQNSDETDENDGSRGNHWS